VDAAAQIGQDVVLWNLEYAFSYPVHNQELNLNFVAQAILLERHPVNLNPIMNKPLTKSCLYCRWTMRLTVGFESYSL